MDIQCIIRPLVLDRVEKISKQYLSKTVSGCSVLTRLPQRRTFSGNAAFIYNFPMGSQGCKEGKKILQNICTHMYISLKYKPKFNWL